MPLSRRALSTSAATLKQALLEHLCHRSYVKLAPSRIAGVGVIALREIPPNTDPFLPPNPQLRPPEPPCVPLLASDLASVPASVVAQLRTFFAALDDPRDPTGAARLRSADGAPVLGVSATGLESLDVSWFVNHGEEPNLTFREASTDDGEEFNRYVTNRTVAAGEELLTDYRAVCSELHAMTIRPGAAAAAERRAHLAEQLAAAEASVAQLRRELERS